VEIGAGEPIVVTVTNVRETGGIGITKSLSGPISGAPTTFSAFLDCDGDAYDQPVSLTLAPDVAETVLVDGIPTGTHCVFTEPSIPPQWTLGGIASNEITIDTTDIIEINIVNVRVVGELTIVKQIDGNVGQDVSFDLTLDCSDDLFDTDVPVDIPSGSTSVSEAFSGIPTGVTCQVDESTLPAGWTLVSIAPEEVTISEEAATITVTNAADGPSPPPIPNPSPSPPSTAPPSTTDPSTMSPSGRLPNTGGPTVWAIIAAVLLITVGGILTATDRRRRH
jgi:LPXTG-motif cell wall-anchored protein